MNTPIKAAICSYGMSGQVFHGPTLKVSENFDVVQILERTKNLSKDVFPNAVISRSYGEILGNTEIELVIVNTPDAFHYKMVKQALEAGKHVVVEKPVTQKREDVLELIKLANGNNLILTVYQNRRWDGDFLTVQKILAENKLGRIVEFESHFDRYRTFITPDTWKEKGDEYAGVLYNLGSHTVDQAYVLFGMPKAVFANLKIVRTGGVVTDYYDIRLEYDGFTVILKCSYLVKDPGPHFTIHGEFGTFYKYGMDPQEDLLKAGNLPDGNKLGREADEEWGTILYEEEGEDIEELVETVAGNYNIFYENVYNAIRKGDELLVKPEETAEVLRILDACLESNKKRSTILL